MSFELPKDAEGREIPLDTVVLFNARGDAFNIVRWVYTTDFETWSESNAWRAIAESHRAFDPELMHLTPPDSWEKLEEDLGRGASNPEYAPCFYFRKAECDCSSCEADRYSGCDQTAFKDILDRISRLRGES